MGGAQRRAIVGLATLIVVTGYVGLPGAATGLTDDPLTTPDPLVTDTDEAIAAHLETAAPETQAIQRSQLALADEITRHLRADQPGEQQALTIARTALQERAALLEELGRGHALEGLNQLDANLDLTEQATASQGDELGDAVELLETASTWQASTFGWQAPGAAEALAPTSSPSQAIADVAEAHGVELTDSQRADAAALDELAEPVRDALASTLEAYLALDRATTQAFAASDAPSEGFDAREQLDWLAEIDHDPDLAQTSLGEAAGLPSPSERASELAIDHGGVLDARLDLLATVDVLHERLDGHDVDLDETVSVPGVVAVDLADQADVYTEDYALLVDAGGDDTYHNNAGGSNVGDAGCAPEESSGAAVLVDLDGDDAYGDPANPRSCGANGGGATGVGLLVDAGGSDAFYAGGVAANGGGYTGGLGLIVDAGGPDTYHAFSVGTNGGAIDGAGLILDLAGDDDYHGGSLGSNGAATAGGAGAIVDTTGDDEYTAGIIGINGGGDGYLLGTGVGVIVDADGENTYATLGGGNGAGSRNGVGFLYDGPGPSSYEAHAFGANGGSNGGVSMLLDAGGENSFNADYTGVNGGATTNAVSFLVNLGEASVYEATYQDEQVAHASRGLNGGAADGAVSLLVNANGGSLFDAGSIGVNGGSRDGGISLLVSGEGADTYRGQSAGANGGTSGGHAMLVDLGGDDTYVGEDRGVNGGGYGSDTAGILLDRGGHDRYVADASGVNGGARNGGHGLLLDESGDDTYIADGRGANGGAESVSYGLLLDTGGTDYYEDDEGGTGWDRTVVPKGVLGAQVDEGPAP